MNIFDILKYAKVAWTDKAQVEHLVSQAKVMEGPKASWKTGEFWINQVVPTLAALIGGAAAVFTAPALLPWFTILLLGVSAVGYLGRTWLKAQHLNVGSLADPATVAQLGTVAQTIGTVVNAMKLVTAGKMDAAAALTDTLSKTDAASPPTVASVTRQL